MGIPSAALSEIGREASWLLAGGAPEFVVRSSPKIGGNEIPVFVFHSIEPRAFERQLEFLQRNDYQTLSADEFQECLIGKRPTPRKAVLLTIDDGRSSVRTFGFPLLEKYGFRAVCFLIPGYISNSSTNLPHLGDVWEGRLPASGLVNRDPDLMTWDQIRYLHDRGCIEFQSHTMHHHRVFSSPVVTGFVSDDRSSAIFDLVLPFGYESKAIQGRWEELWGIPIYESHSLMAGRPRYLSEPELADHCNQYVHDHGGRHFFESRNWTRELKEVIKDLLQEGQGNGRMQSEQDLRTEILDNLTTSKRLIEDRVPGAQVHHLSYPYGEGSGLAAELSKQAGFISSFGQLETEDVRISQAMILIIVLA